MPVFASLAGLVVSLALLAVSARMNYVFWSHQGASEEERQLMGAASVALDLLKPLFPLFAQSSLADGRLVSARITWAFFAALTVGSLYGSIGFVTMSRAGAQDALVTEAAGLSTVLAEKSELEKRVGALSAHRPEPIVKEELAAAKRNPRWQGSRECRQARTSDDREFCGGVDRLRVELAVATEAAGIEGRVAKLRTKEMDLRRAGAGRAGDVREDGFRSGTGFGSPLVRTAGSVLFALLVEFGSGLGVAYAMAQLPGRRRRKKRTRPIGGRPSLRVVDGRKR